MYVSSLDSRIASIDHTYSSSLLSNGVIIRSYLKCYLRDEASLAKPRDRKACRVYGSLRKEAENHHHHYRVA